MTAAHRRQVIEAASTAVFGERGYHAASIDEIARRSGVSAPVVYDHFSSKRDLYQHLIEGHYEELRAIWFRHAGAQRPVGTWIESAFSDWFEYLEKHPFAGRMLFQDTTGDPDIAAAHRAIRDASRDELLPLIAVSLGIPSDRDDAWALELAWESLRSVLQGLALWWLGHPEVPREAMVTGAMNSAWIGFERLVDGDRWRPTTPPPGG